MTLIARWQGRGARLSTLASALFLFGIASQRASAEPLKLQSTSALIASGKTPWRQIAIRNEVLLQCDRIAPAELSGEQTALLAAHLQTLGASQVPEVLAVIKRLPLVATLAFDGKTYSGENFGFIDAIIGLGGRPIAMDREPPALLLPLAGKDEERFAKKRNAFQAARENAAVIKATAAQWASADGKPGADVGASLAADGQILRLYAGRFDDLYFHLFENGNGPSGIAFWSMADGLLQRRYSPLTGLADAVAIPALAFSLSDVFSNGGRSAIEAWQTTQGKEQGGALQQFAFQVFPVIAGRLGAAAAGTSVIATRQDYAKFLAHRRTLYPLSVPPLFRSPDRFLGRLRGGLMCVGNEQRIILSDADAMFPLPDKGSTPQPEFPGAEDAKSAQLFSSSTMGGMAWEDPAESKLLSEAGGAGTSPADDPRLRPAAQHWLLVITPALAETSEYRKAMAENDVQLRAQHIVQERARWIGDQLKTISAVADAPLIAGVRADLLALQQVDERAHAAIMKLLRARFDLRAELEERLRERMKPLQTTSAPAQKPPLAL